MVTSPYALASILLTEANKGDLEEALAAIKSRAQVFPTADCIIDRVAFLEDRLMRSGVAVSNRAGCTYAFREPGPGASAYRYRKTVITFALKRTAKGWYVTSAGNEEVHPKQPRIDQINLTLKAKNAVVRTALAGYGIVLERKTEAA